jgi:hypothetical protein
LSTRSPGDEDEEEEDVVVVVVVVVALEEDEPPPAAVGNAGGGGFLRRGDALARGLVYGRDTGYNGCISEFASKLKLKFDR